MPSPYESLSMVLLESVEPGNAGARERALRGAARDRCCARTAGSTTSNAIEFAAALDYLLDHRDAARELGAQGRAYVDREYRWPTVLGKIESLLAEIRPRR